MIIAEEDRMKYLHMLYINILKYGANITSTRKLINNAYLVFSSPGYNADSWQSVILLAPTNTREQNEELETKSN